MLIKIKNTNINYVRYGDKSKQAIVLLHGWGQNIEMMQPVGDAFTTTNDVIAIDLPGHGASEEPKEVLQLSDFVEIIKELLDQLKIKNPILIGHSFGGKISLLYASKYSVKKLVLLASPYKTEMKELSLKTKALKQLKKVPGLKKLENFAKKHIGSTDYRNASPIMRQILVEHVNLDLTEEVSKIKCPTLLIWGTLDQEVPVEEAYELEELIEDSGVVIYEGCTHYAYLERLGQTIHVLNSFLKD